jgi:hypothetical protein
MGLVPQRTANELVSLSTDDGGADGDAKSAERTFLLSEYEALRGEVIARLSAQAQIISLAVTLLGALIAGAAVILISGSTTALSAIPFGYLVLGLLTLSTLFSALLWAYIDHEQKVVVIALYNDGYLREQAIRAGGNSAILAWDRFRSQFEFPSANGLRSLLVRLFVLVRAASRHALMSVSAIISLALAYFEYLEHASLPPTDTFSWVQAVFLVGVSLYFLFAAIYSFYVWRLLRRLTAKWSSKD